MAFVLNFLFFSARVILSILVMKIFATSETKLSTAVNKLNAHHRLS